MTMDAILELISRKGEYEKIFLPLGAFNGEKGRYIKLGVFKRTGHVIEEVGCPNGCGEYVKVLRRQNGTYFVVCSHGDKEMEFVDILAEEVELYEFDRVVFNRCVESGKIDYVPPSTPQEREGDPVKAKAFLQKVARDVKRVCKLEKYPQIQEYIFENAIAGNPHYVDCEELRNLAKIHKWQDNSIYTYIRDGFAGASRTKTIMLRSKICAKRKRVKKDLKEM
jgi:hypothetical protein